MDSRIEKRKRNWLDLYEGKRESVVIMSYDHNLGERPWPYPENREGRIRWALDSYRKGMEALDWLEDDGIPHLFPYTGTEVFAEAFGCRVHYPGNDMPFALPAVRNAKEFARLKTPKLWDSNLAVLFDTGERLISAEPDGLMQLPDIQSPLDIAALIWEKEDFYAAMYEEPSAVKELIAMTQGLLTEFLDEWFKRFGTEFIAHYPDYYMPFGVTLSEDEVGAISPEMFGEFSLGGINELSRRYGKLGVHCCADSIHQWDGFASMENLVLLNLNQPAEIIKKAYRRFAGVCAQMHTGLPEEEIDFPEARIVYQTGASDRDDAKRKLEKIRMGDIA